MNSNTQAEKGAVCILKVSLVRAASFEVFVDFFIHFYFLGFSRVSYDVIHGERGGFEYVIHIVIYVTRQSSLCSFEVCCLRKGHSLSQ